MTLVELVIGLVLLGLIGVTLTTVLLRQQRFHAGATAIRGSRERVRDVAAILPADLRGVSAVGGDLYELGANSLRFRAQTGSSVVCTISASRTTITIPPLSLASRSGVTAWVSIPQVGDSVFILDEGATEATNDDTWRRYALTSTPASGSCPTTSRFTATTLEAGAGHTLILSAALPTTTPVGSVIRFFRTAEYRLYSESAGWYLGYSDCPGGTCTPLQPVSGPFPAPVAAGGAGLRFTYLDSLGAVTAVPGQVSRIQFTVRAQTSTPVSFGGFHSEYHRDSLTVTVAFRNRR